MKKYILLILIFFLAGIIFLPYLAHAQGMMGYWPQNEGYGYNMMGYGYSPFGFIFMIIFWILLALLIAFLVKWSVTSPWRNNSKNNSALDILKERYAKGEINKEEFEQKKKDLI
jgi:putative membrane protein